MTNVLLDLLQVLYKILKSERVSERNKQRIKLKDFGYLGLVCCLEAIPVTMTTVRCLYEQVLATGNETFSVPNDLIIHKKTFINVSKNFRVISKIPLQIPHMYKSIEKTKKKTNTETSYVNFFPILEEYRWFYKGSHHSL